MTPAPGQKSISLVEVLRFVIATLIGWARSRQYGELRIVVQDGQIEFVHESTSHRGTLPKRSGPGGETADRMVEHLARTG